MRCLGCRAKDTYWCEDCQATLIDATMELRGMLALLGEGYGEGHLVLTLSELLESERLLDMTPLGKVSMMRRATELLLEVEDHFTHTPMCPACRKHKMELKVGEPLKATCTGGCEL